ncbi:hypothetical protein SALBM217S_01061 [Streptomyces griseoloalbus]
MAILVDALRRRRHRQVTRRVRRKAAVSRPGRLRRPPAAPATRVAEPAPLAQLGGLPGGGEGADVTGRVTARQAQSASGERHSGTFENVALSIILAVPFALAWALGDSIRTRRAYFAQLEERAARLEKEREAQAKVAVAAERARIARELHDVVAHNVSVMVVQADGAADVLDAAPDQAKKALETIPHRPPGPRRDAPPAGRAAHRRAPGGWGSTCRSRGSSRSRTSSSSAGSPGCPWTSRSRAPRANRPGGSSDRLPDRAGGADQHPQARRPQRGRQRAPGVLRRRAGLPAQDDGKGAPHELYEEGGFDGQGHGLIGMRERVGMVGAERWTPDHGRAEDSASARCCPSNRRTDRMRTPPVDTCHAPVATRRPDRPAYPEIIETTETTERKRPR